MSEFPGKGFPEEAAGEPPVWRYAGTREQEGGGHDRPEELRSLHSLCVVCRTLRVGSNRRLVFLGSFDINIVQVSQRIAEQVRCPEDSIRPALPNLAVHKTSDDCSDYGSRVHC